MKRRRIVAHICAFTLATSLIAVDTLPAFAAAVSEETAADGQQVMEEDFADEVLDSIGNTEAEHIAGTEMADEVEPKSDTEISTEAELEPDVNLIPAVGEEQEAPSAGQENDDGLIYVDDAFYNGYYMDAAGILYTVTDGKAEPAAGMMEAGTTYYSIQSGGTMALQAQMVFVDGKAYTGYYMDSAILYIVSNGAAEPAVGTVEAGTLYYGVQTGGNMTLQVQTVFVSGKAYSGYYMDNAGILYTVENGAAVPVAGTVNAGALCYSIQSGRSMTLQTQAVFVGGKAYTGYYMDNAGILYTVSEGAAEPVIGTLEAGEKYYDDKTGTTLMFQKNTLYVSGKVYSGYYLDGEKNMYSVKKGTGILKTGTLKAGSKYYSYNEKKTKTLSKKTLYVKGEIYSGYYMSGTGKLYHVKKGMLTLKTGTLKKGTRYYNYNTKKTKTLSKQTVYVKGKVYTGFYMDNKNRMYSVKKGVRTLKTGVVKKGSKYYSYIPKKTKKLSKETLYVNGKAYTGYYMDREKLMYSVKKGALTLVTGVMGKETKYYSYQSKKTEKLLKEALYVDGKVYSGYCLGNDNKMYTVSNDICTPVNTMLSEGTAYYSGRENKMLTLPGPMIYVYGKAMDTMNVEQMEVLFKAQAVVQEVSEPTDSKDQKLYKCFLWMKKFPYVQYRTMNEAYTSDPWRWDIVFANDIFDTHSGCCASGASAFAYMAKACGYENVTICSDTKHAWVDIDGRLYDPLFAKDRDFSKNYNAAYTDYRIRSAYSRTL